MCQFIRRRLLDDRKLCEFTEGLIAGVKEHQAQIDATISQVAENWRLDRMAAIDRNILRLALTRCCFGRKYRPRSRSTRRSSWPSATAPPSRAVLSTASSTGFSSAKLTSHNQSPAKKRCRRSGPSDLRSSRSRMKHNLSKSLAAARRSRIERAPAGADLHVHTTHSDGACSPSEVVVAAARVGLAALAITDHDTVSALRIARPEASRWGVELIAGVELTCAGAGRELHVLGYFIDDGNAALCEALARLSGGRTERIAAMAASLLNLGLAVDLAALSRAYPRANLGRKHLALYLARTGQVESERDAFARYLADGRPACVDKPRLDAERAIDLIRVSGGIAALAHPPFDFPELRLGALVSAGLQALEVDGPGFSTGKSRRLRAWAARLGLLAVAGSDFHAPGRPGHWIGSVNTPAAELGRLRSAARPAPIECPTSKSPTAGA